MSVSRFFEYLREERHIHLVSADTGAIVGPVEQLYKDYTAWRKTQRKPPKEKVRGFVLSPIGEAFLGDRQITGNWNVAQVAKKLGHEPTQADFDRMYHEEAKSALTEEQYQVFCKTEKAQVMTDKSRAPWNAWGACNDYLVSEAPAVFLATEFYDVVDSPLWAKVEEFIRVLHEKTGLPVHHGCLDEERVESEHSYRVDKAGKKIPGSDMYGAMHGKTVRQLEVVVNLWECPEEKYKDILKTAWDLAKKMDLN